MAFVAACLLDRASNCCARVSVGFSGDYNGCFVCARSPFAGHPNFQKPSKGRGMPFTPAEWNVIVLGRWNRAILTPSGIAKRLFGLEEGTPIEVFVAIDALAPPQVKHGGTIVMVGGDRLITVPETLNFPGLEGAMTIARRAMENLRETPVIAAGINVKYSCKEPLEALQNITRHSWWDDQLSDNQYEILGRELSRVLKWNEGQINFSVTEEADSSFQVQFNFHRGSSRIDELIDWLSKPIADFEKEITRVFSDCMQIKAEDTAYAATDTTT